MPRSALRSCEPSSPRDGRKARRTVERRNGVESWEAQSSVAKQNSMPSNGSWMRRSSLTSPTSRWFSRDIPASASPRSGERRSHGRTSAASAFSRADRPRRKRGSPTPGSPISSARRTTRCATISLRLSSRLSMSRSCARSQSDARTHEPPARLGQLAARTRDEQPSDPGDRRRAMARPRFATRARVCRPPTAATDQPARDAACRFPQRTASRSCRRAARRVTRADTARAAFGRRAAPHDSKSARRSAVPPDTRSDRLGFGRQPLLCARDRSHAPKRQDRAAGRGAFADPRPVARARRGTRCRAVRQHARGDARGRDALPPEPISARCSVRLAAGRERSTRRGQRRRRRGG